MFRLMLLTLLLGACTDPLFQPVPEPLPATNAPNVRIEQPSNGENIGGTVRWVADVSGKVDTVEFLAEEESVGVLTAADGSWAIEFDTTEVDDGENIRLEVIATNTGGERDTDFVLVTIDNTAPEIVAGSLEVDGDGTYVGLHTTLTADFTDDGSGLASCEARITSDADSTSLWVDAVLANGTCTFTSNGCADGAHLRLLLRATDATGNMASTETLNRTCDAFNPTNPTVQFETDFDSISATWDPAADSVSGIADYVFYFGLDNTYQGVDSATSPVTGCNASDCSVNGLPGCTDFHVAVTAIDGAGNESVPDNDRIVTTWCGPDGDFESSGTSTSAGTAIADLVVGDINRDAILDIVVANTTAVVVFFGEGSAGRGTGTFAAGSNGFALSGITDLEIADLDKDHILDLAVAVGNQVWVYWGQGANAVGNGDFAAGPSDSSSADSTTAVLAADFTDDGIPDLAVLRAFPSSSSEVQVLPGDGSRDFGTATASDVDPSTGMRAGDFNNDGVLDLALISFPGGTGQINMLAGNGDDGRGDGTFTAVGGSFASLSTEPREMCVVDFDHDGDLDIIVSSETTASALQKYANNGDFNFGLAHDGQGSHLRGIDCGDLNGDHDVDVVVASAATSERGVIRYIGVTDGFLSSTRDPGFVPDDVALADFDNDAILDFVTWANARADFVVYRGNGENRSYSGSWSADDFDFSDQSLVALTAADFNNDGVLDLAAAGSDDYYVWLDDAGGPGRGNGLFTPASTINTTTGPVAVATGDSNNDEFLDLVTINGTNATIGFQTHSGDGDGTFDTTVIDVPMTGNREDGIVGDFNGDDLMDVVVLTTTGGIYPCLGNGSDGDHAGDFDVPGTAVVTVTGATSLASADLDYDHDLDLVVLTNSGVSVTRGNGGGFATPDTYALAGGGTAVAIADFDEDGILDLAVAHAEPALTILDGNGSGGFTVGFSTPTAEIVSLVAADLNHDGVTDLVGAGGDAITTILGAGSDGRGNGDLQTLTTTSFSHGTGFTDLLVFDVDANGTLDLVTATTQGGMVIRDLGTP